MKKKLLFSIAIIIMISVGYYFLTQDSKQEKLRKQYAEYIKNHPYSKTIKLSKKERKSQGIPPNKYFEQEYLREMNPNTGRTHPENKLQVQKKLKELRQSQRTPGDAGDNPWVERGPDNVGGRTRMVMFDPNDGTNKRVFAGGVSGGLWVNNDITDANSSWTRVAIDENLSVTCMTVDPNNSQIMYLGTGESYTGDDGVGNGIWKSTDGGTTWTNVLAYDVNAVLSSRYFFINDILAWNNGGSTEVFAGVGRAHYGEGAQFVGTYGLYKSTDAGANWAQITVTSPGGTQYEPNDFEVGADNTIWMATERNTFGHGGGTILKSTNGSTFTVAHTIADADRTEIALSTTNASKIYVLASKVFEKLDPVMFVTTDAFATSPTSITTPADADTGISNTDFTRGQAFYDLVIEVDPTNDAIVYAGGIDLFRSTDSGGSWTQISKWSNNNILGLLAAPLVHADQHGWAFHPTDANKAVIGNDGGVFYATSLSTASSNSTVIPSRNTDYNVTQFYHGAIGQDAGSELLLAGAQDNGSQFTTGFGAVASGVNSTTDVYGGDGAYCFIDKDGAYMIVSYVYNDYARLSLPYTGAGVIIVEDDTTGDFINAAELDDNLDILYTNGTGQISRYTDITTASPVRTNFTDALVTGNEITALKVSPYTAGSSKLFIGTDSGEIIRIENANTGTLTWTDLSSGLPAGSISSISFGANENEILVTYHNYGVDSIWYTTNGGITWQDKEGDFPDIPVKAILMNPLNNDEVIIGTELGVWRTGNFKDASPTWTQSNNGMSNVKVTSFDLRTVDNTVLASSYGRGMFTGQFTAGVLSIDEVLADKKVFTVYPTISDGDFTVYAKDDLGKSKLQIFDIAGKQVHSGAINFNDNSFQKVSVNLESGIYILTMIDENNRKSSEKIIIN